MKWPKQWYDQNCRQCPRLVQFLQEVKGRHENYTCKPVPPFGVEEAQLLIVGLAPGKHGANATGRPFTGDHAGILLYQTLYKFGFASEPVSAHANDELQLYNCRITNAVKCLPPQNKPLGEEQKNCNHFLQAEVIQPHLHVILALGQLAHRAILRAFNLKLSQYQFAHNAGHALDNGLILIDSYHCSRYNTHTRRLTEPMFDDVFQRIHSELAKIARGKLRVPETGNNFDSKVFLDMVSEKPGVYIFSDQDEKTLYVGKAGNLKKRLQSYFRNTGLSAKTRLMVSKIHRAETQQTRTESEALLLENNLIKEQKPRYNISLRDDKSFPYIRLTERDLFPRFSFYRGRRTRPHQYYGPYPNATAVREMLALLHKIFRLRQCNDAFFRNRSRPCLQYQIKRCSAPCVGRIGREDYLEDVRQAKAMLGGRDFALLDELAGKMESASTRLDYETAAHYRDRIALLQRAMAKQYVSSGSGNADVVTVALESGRVCFGVVSIRHGRNLGSRFHIQKNPLDLAAAKLLEAFLPQNYFGSIMPAEILLSEKIESRSSLQQVFSIENKSRVEIKHRCRAHRARWIESARVNTVDHLRSHLNQRSQIDAQFVALTDLLSLDEVPARIECFDISHTMGERAVGSCVVFDHQGAVKSDYRKFNISGIEPGDDYAAMQQTLKRRYKRVLQDDGKLPDLVIVDGGKGQLGVAARVFEELQILGSVVLLAVSKGRTRRPGDEQLHLFGSIRAIIPDKTSSALHLIQRVRDEAHRFAITGHRQRRAKARTESPLQQIEGVGDTRRRNLLRYFGGLREVTRAGTEDLAKVPGISPVLAQRIYNRFHN